MPTFATGVALVHIRRSGSSGVTPVPALDKPPAQQCALDPDVIGQDLEAFYGRGPSAAAQHEARIINEELMATQGRGSELTLCS